MIGQRSVWIAARARNAARKGLWIAAFGSVAVITTLLVLATVPREADRQLRRRIASLPSAPDSLPIVRRVDSVRAAQVAVTEALRQVAKLDSTGSDSLADLSMRLRRVQQVPLAEGYRTLAESPMLRNDPVVVALLDSIDVIEREREAHAALGGPGARYAALTARLAVLGQGLVRLAEQRGAGEQGVGVSAGDSLREVSRDRARDSTRDRARDSTRDRARDSLRLAAQRIISAQAADSARLDTLARRLAVDDSLLAIARQRIAARDSQQQQLEQGLNVASPPIAMLLAALVVGVAVGYGVVLARELRRPTVGDVAEVERLTGAPVLRHARDTPSTLVERSRLRERPGVPRIVDRDSDSYTLLHLALTGVGDPVPEVDILADAPVLGIAVALGTAAAAARESRAVLVVEATRRHPLLAHVLQARAPYTLDDVREGRVSGEDAVHVVTLDRDAHIDVLVASTPTAPPTGLFGRRRTPVVPTVRSLARHLPTPAGGSQTPGVTLAPAEVLRRFEERYDLRLHVPDAQEDVLPRARDVIVCVRQGATPLAWLSRVVQQARARQQRLRVAVLWSRDIPPV